jgi:hypothetical protein
MGMLSARKKFSSIAYGSNEEIVVHLMCVGNVEKGVRSERGIGVGGVGGEVWIKPGSLQSG